MSRQSRSGVAGISTCRMPRGDSASTKALATADGIRPVDQKVPIVWTDCTLGSGISTVTVKAVIGVSCRSLGMYDATYPPRCWM